MGLGSIISIGKTFITSNAPQILTAFGIISLGASIATTVVATNKAIEKKEEVGIPDEDASKLDVARHYAVNYGPLYVPSVLLALGSVGCFLGANHIHLKRQAVLLAAYELSEKAYQAWRDKTYETLGDNKTLALREGIAEDKYLASRSELATNPPNLIITPYGDVKCFDPMSGRYFMSCADYIRQAQAKIIKRLPDDMYVSLNDFYDELGLPPTKMGNALGWDLMDIHPDIILSSSLDEHDEPVLVIDYLTGILPNKSRYS